MTIKQAYRILWDYQKWRTDKDVPPKRKMPEPEQISEAINVALETLKNHLQ